MKDPEKSGLANSVAENLDDMTTQARNDPSKLLALMQLFKDMYRISKPFIDPKTKKIQAPNDRIPTESLDPFLVKAINKLDGAFIETLSYNEFPEVFVDSYNAVKKKLDNLTQHGGGFGGRMK